ncbi:MAG: hypothetical protein IPJ71_00325 [Bdellovibrionales bacterium]|nr:hypothetical protein [Bdellovibrionales bacterium]
MPCFDHFKIFCLRVVLFLKLASIVLGASFAKAGSSNSTCAFHLTQQLRHPYAVSAAIKIVVRSLHERRKEIEALSRQYRAVAKVDWQGYVIATPVTLDFEMKRGNLILNSIRQQIKSYQLFLQNLAQSKSKLINRLVAPRLTALDETKKDLKGDISQISLSGENYFYNTMPLSVGKIQAQYSEALKIWITFQNEVMVLQDLIREMRVASPDLLRASFLQNHLVYLVGAGLELTLIQSAFQRAMDSREDYPEFYDVESLFTFFFPGWKGIQVNYSPSNSSFTILMERVLVNELFQEILMNASEANQRRAKSVGQQGDESSSLSDPRPEVLTEILPDKYLIIFRDHGFRHHFNSIRNIGDSNQNDDRRVGVGIGLLKIQLLTEYLGYKIFYKPNNSGDGTCAEVQIPRIGKKFSGK